MPENGPTDNLRDLTFLQPCKRDGSPYPSPPRKTFGPPVDGVYPLIKSAPDSKFWTHTVHNAVSDLRAALPIFKAEALRSSAFIHGQMLAGLGPVTYRRMDRNKWGDTVSIEDSRRCYMLADIDGAGINPDIAKTPQAIWAWVRLTLPEEIRRADIILHLSQSIFTKPGLIKGHAIVELSRPLNYPERNKLLAGVRAVDKSVNIPHQVVFIVDPEFEGCADPLAGTALQDRWFYIEGETRVVEVPTDAELNARAAEAQRQKAEETRAKRKVHAGEERARTRSSTGKMHAGLDYWISQIGAVGDDGIRHFEGPRMAAVRAFVSAEGPNADIGLFLDAVREHLQSLDPAVLPHPGYVESVIADMPRLVEGWIVKLADKERPQPCEWTGPSTVSLGNAEADLAAFTRSQIEIGGALFRSRAEGLAVRIRCKELIDAGRFVEAVALARVHGIAERVPNWEDGNV